MHVGDARARVVYASPTRIAVLVPAGLEGGRTPVTHQRRRAKGRAFVDVATTFATGLHQVDNPVFDAQGNLYVTYSGTRGQQVPVSIFRVRPDGTRETFCSGLVNPTSMAIGPDGDLYVSSRFEGTVYRVKPDGSVEPFATDLGVRVRPRLRSRGDAVRRRSLRHDFPGGSPGPGDDARLGAVERGGVPPRVRPDGALYVTAPTLSPYDPVFRIDREGTVTVRHTGFGRPQGIAFDHSGSLYVVEALAGVSGLYRLPPAPSRNSRSRARRSSASRSHPTGGSWSARTTPRIACRGPAADPALMPSPANR